VNLFHVPPSTSDMDALAVYARALEPLAARYGVALGEPRYDDDELMEKLDVVCAARVPVVSFTFGCPSPEMATALREAGSRLWVTVTDATEARLAADAGADALVCQGVEAGGHRGGFLTRPDAPGAADSADRRGGAGRELGLLALLRVVAAVSELPLVASGGIADGSGVAAVLAAGARAAQLGTAFMRCPEAGTSAPHRDALSRPGETAVTRAFSGRRARGIRNAFMDAYDGAAPIGYPQIHHLTSPLRAAARAAGNGRDSDAINLWAGQAFELAEERPAGELVALFAQQARNALMQAQVLAD
jgi:nitronate monooxygenase